jgi:hypothetical protein
MATGGPPPRIYFTAVDPLGQTVEVTRWRWAHATKGHPAMLGQEQMVKDAIENPETIHEANTAHDKVFKAYRIPGQGFMYGGMYPIVVVRYDSRGTGDLRTTYPSRVVPRAKVLWTHP